MTTKWLRLSLISLFACVAGFSFYGFIALDILVHNHVAQEEARLIDRQMREREVARLRATVVALHEALATHHEAFAVATKKIADLELNIEDGSTSLAVSKQMLVHGIDEQFDSLASVVHKARIKSNRRIATLWREIQQQKDAIKKMQSFRPTTDLLEQKLLDPTVKVSSGREVGSGTVICSRGDETFVLTALHIVGSEGKDDARISVQFFSMHDTISIPADIFASEEKIDVAILKLTTPWKKQHIARLASRERLADTRVFSPVYAIGCPLGYSPMPTKGQISSKTKQLKGQNYWMINAPTIFGNSGGGIYLAETGELIGCLSRVSAYNNFINIAVPHMGIFVPLSEVYDWMDREGLTFLYDPK